MEYKKWISNYNSSEYKEYVKNLSIYDMYKGKISKKN
jgi:thiaminase